MVATVPTGTRSVSDYRSTAGYDLVAEITRLAKPLRGTRILHLSTTPSQPEIAATLSTLTSLMQDIGLNTEWRVIRARQEPSNTISMLQKTLHGKFSHFTPELIDLWREQGDNLPDLPLRDYDLVVVHGTELAGIIGIAEGTDRANRLKWVWHCHCNISKTLPNVWNCLMRHSLRYDHTIISSLENIPTSSYHSCSTIPPVIDPLNLRNRDLPQQFTDSILRHYEIDPTNPIILTTVSGDPDFRDTSRVVEVFSLAREQVPNLQMLLLVADDADGEQSSRRRDYFVQRLGECQAVRVIPMPDGIGNISINAFQRCATAVIESSQDEELAPSILETMWKARPVIVSESTATRLGIIHGTNGYVANSTKEMSRQLIRLIESRTISGKIGERSCEHVRANFLITRLLRIYLEMIARLVNREALPKSRVVAM